MICDSFLSVFIVVPVYFTVAIISNEVFQFLFILFYPSLQSHQLLSARIMIMVSFLRKVLITSLSSFFRFARLGFLQDQSNFPS